MAKYPDRLHTPCKKKNKPWAKKADFEFYKFIIHKCSQFHFADSRCFPRTGRLRRITRTAFFGAKVLELLEAFERDDDQVPVMLAIALLDLRKAVMRGAIRP